MRAASVFSIAAVVAVAMIFLPAARAANDEAAGAPQAGTYPLQPVTPKAGVGARAWDARGCGNVWLVADKDGNCETPFATASGKLRMRVDGGKILVDRNDDGKIDKDDGEASDAWSISIPVKLAGKPFEYPLTIGSFRYNLDRASGERKIAVCSMVYLEAKAGETVIRVYDENVNGRFGDSGDTVQFGAQGKSKPIAKYCEIGGALYEFAILNDGEAVKLQPYAGPMATVTVEGRDGWKVFARLRHAEHGLEPDTANGGTASALPGPYRLLDFWAVHGAKGTSPQELVSAPTNLRGAGAKDAVIQIKAGENRLTFGPPFKLDFAGYRSSEDSADVEIQGVTLTGAGGEVYRAYNYGSGGDSKLTCYVRSGGKEKKVASLAFG